MEEINSKQDREVREFSYRLVGTLHTEDHRMDLFGEVGRYVQVGEGENQFSLKGGAWEVD